ncbi:unnamed protein product [Symbiodinium sp. CCMP2456]|nr:unnamed protein product [Symbiodinium sp. CCMP2456]
MDAPQGRPSVVLPEGVLLPPMDSPIGTPVTTKGPTSAYSTFVIAVPDGFLLIPHPSDEKLPPKIVDVPGKEIHVPNPASTSRHPEGPLASGQVGQAGSGTVGGPNPSVSDSDPAGSGGGNSGDPVPAEDTSPWRPPEIVGSYCTENGDGTCFRNSRGLHFNSCFLHFETNTLLRAGLVTWEFYAYIDGLDTSLEAGQLFVAQSEIRFYGGTVCIVPARAACPDGLPLTPVAPSECPSEDMFLKGCDLAQPGEFCEATGVCDTRIDLVNCGVDSAMPRGVYKKGLPATTWTTTSTTTVTATSTYVVDGLWRYWGPCQVNGACLSSPNFPDAYGAHEICVASLPDFSVLRVNAFATGTYRDFLTVNGKRYSGPRWLGPKTFVLHSKLSWRSDGQAGGGWELCVQDLPSCVDGLELKPVAVPDCPPGTESLPNCRSAAPGELCEGDGTCGTRTDIDNCYDASYSQPPRRDVYEKFLGSTRTTTTSQSFTLTSTTLTTATATYGDVVDGWWRYWGPCQVNGACLSSPNYPNAYGAHEICVASLPDFSVVRVSAFKTDTYNDFLTVNGKWYSGPRWLGPKTFVLQTNLSWRSDDQNGYGGWELCVQDLPSCPDGLELKPVAVPDCPPGTESLPNCHGAAPGELCEGDGTCDTRTDIDNCYDASYSHPPTRDVYVKSQGVVATSTTQTASTTHTRTSTVSTTTLSWKHEGPWSHVGPCAVRDGCAASPASGETSEAECSFVLPRGSTIKVEQLKLLRYDGDRLVVDGVSLGNSVAGKILPVTSGIFFKPHSSRRRHYLQGRRSSFEICVNHPKCWDGLPLVPVEWEECPLGWNVPSCLGSEAGELCEANGECFTPEKLMNCEGKSIYRKANGTTRTSTTSTASTTFTTTGSTTTATVAFSFGAVRGPCKLSGACVQSPNYPLDYESNEGCEVFLNEPSVATFTESSGCFDDGENRHFYIDGNRFLGRRRRYSGDRMMVLSRVRFVPTGLAGRRRRHSGWCSDGSTYNPSTWRICWAAPVEGDPEARRRREEVRSSRRREEIFSSSRSRTTEPPSSGSFLDNIGGMTVPIFVALSFLVLSFAIYATKKGWASGRSLDARSRQV